MEEHKTLIIKKKLFKQIFIFTVLRDEQLLKKQNPSSKYFKDSWKPQGFCLWKHKKKQNEIRKLQSSDWQCKYLYPLVSNGTYYLLLKHLKVFICYIHFQPGKCLSTNT